jgi:23S rRNA (uracil1939-C5)-methyltransferase
MVRQAKPAKPSLFRSPCRAKRSSARVTLKKSAASPRPKLEQVLTRSPNRIAPPCPHFGVCGGCHYQHANYPAQLEIKRAILRETLARAGVVIPAEIGLLAAEPWAYRNRIRLAFAGLGEFGYRGRRSHAIIPIGQCPIAAPGLLRAARKVAGFLAQNPGPSAISEMELFCNSDETQMLITLFCEKALTGNAQSWLAMLLAALPPEVAGIRIQLADGSLSPQVVASVGEPSLAYTAAGIAYRVDHGAFFQVNRRLVDEFVSLVTGGQSGALAWDLYAGVGLFARRLASGFGRVLAIESAPASCDALRHNLAGTSGNAIASTTLDFLRRNREEREQRADLIVLDPPRAGLGEETVTLLNAVYAPAMVYASCDPATLARDLHALTQERYRIERITLVDMFPQTFHMETVVQLRRC